MDQFRLREAGGGYKIVQNNEDGRREANILRKGGKIGENVGNRRWKVCIFRIREVGCMTPVSPPDSVSVLRMKFRCDDFF